MAELKIQLKRERDESKQRESRHMDKIKGLEAEIKATNSRLDEYEDDPARPKKVYMWTCVCVCQSVFFLNKHSDASNSSELG